MGQSLVPRSHCRRPEEEICESQHLCHVGEALSPPIPGSVSEPWRLWSMRWVRLLALRVHESLVSLFPNELNRVFKADWVCFSFLAWLPNVFHCGRGSPSPMSLFKLLIKVLVPITLSLETMSRPIALLCSLLRDQIWTHCIKAKCQS